MVGMMGWGMPEQGWRKGPWTPEEDKLLTEHVSLHGEGRWSSVTDCSGLNRSGKSCRLRWVNYLRPGLKKGQLTPQEEGIIIELHALWGNKWSTIARYLPGRTDNEIKNYWRTHFKKKAKPSLKQQKYKAEAFRQRRRQQLEHDMINKVTHEEENDEKLATETQTKQEMVFTYPINTFEQQYWTEMSQDVTSCSTDNLSEEGFWSDLLWILENDSSHGGSNGFFQDQVVAVGTTCKEQSFSSF